MLRGRRIAIALLWVAPICAFGTPPASSKLRIPLGFDVFFDWTGPSGGSVSTTPGSVVQAKLLPSASGKETVYVRAVALGKTTVRSKSPKGPSLDVEVVRASEGEYAEFVAQELGAGRIVEPLPLAVGEAPSVVHEDVVDAVVVSDEMRLRVEKRKSGKHTAVTVSAVSPGWATLTIFDNHQQIARRFAFHLTPKVATTRNGKSAPVPAKVAAVPTMLSTPTSRPATQTPTPLPTPGDPEATVLMTLPQQVGVVVPFTSPIPSVLIEPKKAVEYRRLLLPAGRQALYVIGREVGPAVLRVADGKGEVRHEFRIRVVPPDSTALSQRCESERRQGGPCEAVLLRAGELKIVDIPVPVGTVVSSDENLLRYARRSGSEMGREISLQALGSGVTDLNLFDEQGLLRRRMILRIDSSVGTAPPIMIPSPAPGLPIPK